MLKRSLVIAGGAAVFVVTVLGCFWKAGALRAMYDAMIEWPARHYVQSQGTVYAKWIAQFLQSASTVREPFGTLGKAEVYAIVGLPLVGVACIALGIVAAVSTVLRGRLRFAPLLVMVTAGSGAAHLALPGINRDVTHCAFVGGFLLCAIASSIRLITWRSRRLHGFLSAAVVLAGGLALVVYIHRVVLTWDASRRLGTWKDSVGRNDFASWIDLNLAPEARIVSGYQCGYDYFHIRRAAVPITNLPHSVERWPHYYTEAQWRSMASAIIHRRPRAMVLSSSQWRKFVRLRPEMAQMYRRLDQSRAFTLWELVE